MLTKYGGRLNALAMMILIMMSGTVACSHMNRGRKVVVPDKPQIRPVEVKDGCICGKNKDAVIDNHIDCWEHAERLRKLLGK